MKYRPIPWLRTALVLTLSLAWGLGMWLSPVKALQATPSEVGGALAAPVQQTPVVRMMVFHSATCPSCQALVDEFLPSVQSTYGSRVEMLIYEISDPANMQMLVALERAYGVPADQTTIPEIFVGNDVFLGADVIRYELTGTIDGYLDQGGVDLTPPMKDLLAERISDDGAVVHAAMFYMSTCSHCHEVIDTVLPVLEQRYGSRFQLELINVDGDQRYEQFIRYIESLLGQQQLLGVPTMVIDSEVLVGSYEIATQAEPLIQKYLGQGGIEAPPNFPVALDGFTYELGMTSDNLATPQARPTPEGTSTPTTKPTIHLAYFYQPGCRECDRVDLALNYMQGRYPQLQVESFDVKEYADLSEWLGQQANVPNELRLTAPAVFVETRALIGDDITLDSLEALIQEFEGTGAAPIWKNYQEGEATQSIINRFRSLGVFTVLGAGLIDGLNPCAFATLVFFLSYLALSGRQGRDLLAVGGAFTLGVFVTYLAVGLGLWKLLGSLGFLSQLSRWIYGITALLCAILAVLSIADYIKARQGRAGEMSLSLPKVLRKRINAVIRNAQAARAMVAIALVTGVVVSLIELACTGQVYLPTIIFVLSVPELQTRAAFYLVLYNIFFILPLIVVFVLAYLGTTGNQFGIFLRKHTATIKLVTGVLFIALTGWLVYALL